MEELKRLEVLFTAFGMVALLYTLAMAQLVKDEAGCVPDCLDLHNSRRKATASDFLVNI